MTDLTTSLKGKGHCREMQKNSHAGRERKAMGAVLQIGIQISAIEQNMDEQLWLQNEHRKSLQDKEKVKQYMESTYPLQRKVINDKISIGDMKKEWPYLSEEKFFCFIMIDW